MDIYGKPLNDRGLAVRLKPYGVKSKPVRIGDVVLKGYTTEDLWDAWMRYLPSCHTPGNKGTGVQMIMKTKMYRMYRMLRGLWQSHRH